VFWSTTIGHGPNYFDPVADLESRLGRPLDRTSVLRERRAVERELVTTQPVLPGVVEWRDEARRRGLRLGIASSSGRAWVTGHLDRLGLDGWECICCGDEVQLTKPAPDLYLAATACLGVAPREALALEDSVPGVTAATTAGLRCVAVPSPFTAAHDFGAADLVLGSLSDTDLGAVLKALDGGGRP
jgi:HAD superfamily hydrolase (TIGR01509 family)